MRRIKTAVLISGNGSNLQAILDAAREPDYPAEIALVMNVSRDALKMRLSRARTKLRTLLGEENETN